MLGREDCPAAPDVIAIEVGRFDAACGRRCHEGRSRGVGRKRTESEAGRGSTIEDGGDVNVRQPLSSPVGPP